MTTWKLIWSDGFESGVGNWVTLVGYHVQTSEKAKTGTYSAKQYDDVFSRTIEAYRDFGKTVTKKLKIDLWVKPEPTLYNGEAWYVDLGNGSTKIFSIALVGTGASPATVYWYDGTNWFDTGLDWYIGTPWIHVVAEFDFDAGTVDLWMSDVGGTLQKATSVGYRVADPSIGANRINRRGYLLYAGEYWYWDDVEVYEEATDSTEVTIIGPSNSVKFDVLTWKESQNCNPAINPVPKRTTGAFIDTGTYTLETRLLTITARFTTTKLSTLNSIFIYGESVSITTPNGWTYTAWFSKKPVVWEYKKVGGEEREWHVTMEFICTTFSYSA